MVTKGTAVSSRLGRSARPAASRASATTSAGKDCGTSNSRRTAANRSSRAVAVPPCSAAGRKMIVRFAMASP